MELGGIMPEEKTIILSISREWAFPITDPVKLKEFQESEEAFKRHARNMGKMQAYLDELEKAKETGDG